MKNTGPSFDNFLLAAAQESKKTASPDEEPAAAQITYEEILEKGSTDWAQEMRKEELKRNCVKKSLPDWVLQKKNYVICQRTKSRKLKR
jgi:hypothetical protein